MIPDPSVPGAPGPVEASRVAIVSDAEPERNGVGAYYADLVDHLRERVGEVAVLAPGRDDTLRGVSFPLPGDATQTLTFPNPMAVRRRLQALRPHAVIVPTPGPWGLLGARLAAGQGARLVVGFHTHYERLADLYWRTALGMIPRSYMRIANGFLFERGQVVLANSHAMADAARALGARAVQLMGTPIPRGFLETPPAPLAGPIRRVLFAGRLAPEKNVAAVMDAARARPDIAFTIAGDGPERAALEAQAADLANVTLPGWTPRARLPGLMDAHDALVLPSHVESLGTIALEALARGRTVLVSTHCGITEWPMLDRALFRIGDGETLAEALTRVASLDAAIRRRKAELGAEGAREMNAAAIRGWLDVLAAPVAATQA
ncbi:glycosyltransferase family 1 protein [Roseospira marina]|uniref:Glycosyltransferase family 1 protein n=1 Tax=Roseospira marina TaxID=140057 RepID=A0A5M6IEG8_9PROT|nr:glycosyltransferase [Roseospira marina]KAA5606670.1 glycosyltransferase family 1 protein [Roseospira marina]MBB4313920.1 glycosyltransferase involved in cell wall biosynthesis [Roseospira marina]MBB5087082.1 glycosyltransferase involved in cell wall biosynthesis [Roseospira marina]